MTQMTPAKNAIERGKVYGVILAGGLGSRLNGITNSTKNAAARPKACALVLTGLGMDYSTLAFERLGLKQVFISTNASYTSQIQDQMYKPKDLKITMWPENTQLGTARAIDFFLKSLSKKMGAKINDCTVLVQACDTPHNLDLMPMLESHLGNQGSITIGVTSRSKYLLEKESKQRTFATVVTEGFDFTSKKQVGSEYEEMLDAYYGRNIGCSKPISYFCEESDRDDSPFISTHIYAINVEFWMDVISKNIRSDFSDFGFHIFPAMASLSLPQEFRSRQIDDIKKAMQGHKFEAYFFPQQGAFWCDVGTPYLLWMANKLGLSGEFSIPESFGKLWKQEPWGLLGVNPETGEPSKIDLQARIKEPIKTQEKDKKAIGNIIGQGCDIGKYAHINNSVIGDHTIIDEKVHLDSVLVLPGTPEKPNYIAKADLTNSIVAGGSIPGKRILKPISASGAIIYRGIDEESKEDELIIGKLRK